MVMMINESKDVSLYKKMVSAFGEFTEMYPGTGASKIYQALLSKGHKCMPKDKRAQDILFFCLDNKSDSGAAQCLMNTNFSSLPTVLCPNYLENKKKMIAFWNASGQLCSKAIDLVDLEMTSGKKFWSDEKGEKVTLIDVQSEEDK